MTFRNFVSRAGSRVKRLLSQIFPVKPGVPYWKRRVRKLGKRSVINAAYAADEFDKVTEAQRATLIPLFSGCLNGTEQVVLDLGCGPGRFTLALANAIGGRCIGIDPIETLLALAPQAPNVEYLLMSEGSIPLPSASVDAVWICLVLGGIRGVVLEKTVKEVCRVLKNEGLLFVVEDTPEMPSSSHWSFRSVHEYGEMFPDIELKEIGAYTDRDIPASVLAGRLKMNPSARRSH
jgi:ubiquinone/menaquinone biosynthesis C-methylase UbiE